MIIYLVVKDKNGNVMACVASADPVYNDLMTQSWSKKGWTFQEVDRHEYLTSSVCLGEYGQKIYGLEGISGGGSDCHYRPRHKILPAV